MSEEEKIYEEEKLDIDLGHEENFFVANNGNYFGIGFDKICGMPQLAIYNTFEMTSKRNFKNLSSSIYDTYVELFLNEDGSLKDESELVFFNLLRVKSEIMVNPTTYDKFIEYMEVIMSCGDKLLLSIINNYVESNYSLNLDKLTQQAKDKKRKVNTELQFSDEHAKALLKISYLYRVMIPVISVYFFYNKGSFNSVKSTTVELDSGEVMELSEDDVFEIEFDEVNTKIFAYLFDKFAENPDALRNKLYRLAFSGVSKTQYSDRRFWLAAKNVGITDKTEALQIYKKLLTNAIPKLSIDGNKNIISFLQSVINNQVDFLFQNKFRYRFIPVGPADNASFRTNDDEDDDNGVSEFERMELLSTRKDEGAYLIRKANIRSVVESIPGKLDVGVSDAEVKDLMQKIKRSSIQEQIVALLTFKYFEDKDAIKYISFYQYCYLVIACKKYLEAHKFVYLPLILTSNCEKHKERVSITGKKVKPEILSSKKYTDLVAAKYPNFSKEIEKPFLAFIATVHASVFTDANGVEIFDASVKVGKIAEEIVDLAQLV